MNQPNTFGDTQLRTVVSVELAGQEHSLTGYVSKVEGRTYKDPRTGDTTVGRLYEVTVLGKEAPPYTLRVGERMECNILGKGNIFRERR